MYRKNYYNDKIHSDSDFYKNEKERLRLYQSNRYETDEDFRNKKIEYSRNYYLKKKKNLKSLQVLEKI
jgi:hypothetical protein